MERYLAAAYRSAAIRASPREEAQTRLCEAELVLKEGDWGRAENLLAPVREAFVEMAMPFFAERAEAMLETAWGARVGAADSATARATGG